MICGRSCTTYVSAPEGRVGQSRGSHALPTGKKYGTLCTGGRVGLRACLDRSEDLTPPGCEPRTV